jgi:hypothetical protein
MAGSIDESYLPRLYRCEECRSILGVVLRNKNRVRRLFVFLRYRVHEDDIPPTEILIREAQRPTRRHSIYNVHNMDQGCVECGHCHAIQEWRMSPEALDELNQKESKVRHAEP